MHTTSVAASASQSQAAFRLQPTTSCALLEMLEFFPIVINVCHRGADRSRLERLTKYKSLKGNAN